MKHNCSEACSNCKNLKKKLELYENFMKGMKDIEADDNYNQNYNGNSLTESVIFEKDNYGNLNKKVKSDLTESFLVIENGKKLEELNKREQDIIKEQDSYSNYQNASAYCQKASGLYKVAYYALSIGKWFVVL